MKLEPYNPKVTQRQVPDGPLDYTMLVTEPEWGKGGIGQDLQDKLKKDKNVYKNEKGELFVSKESLWGMLGFYTRDMRLGNLDKTDMMYCAHYIDLANDLLNCDMIEPFLIALSRAATRLELSQSKKGFLRQMNNTLRQENIHQGYEPPKKSIMQNTKRRD